MWLKEREEEVEFDEDLAEGILALEWWDPNNPSNDSIWYEEEKLINKDDLWSKDSSE